MADPCFVKSENRRFDSARYQSVFLCFGNRLGILASQPARHRRILR